MARRLMPLPASKCSFWISSCRHGWRWRSKRSPNADLPLSSSGLVTDSAGRGKSAMKPGVENGGMAMHVLIRPVALAAAAFTLASVSPAEEARYSPELLAHLDPSARAADLCSGKDGAAGMRAKLMVSAAVVQAAGETAVRLVDGLGKVHFPITTSSPQAQRYFDQGLGFAYGFNHAAAIAAFREAQRLDPSCALCFWGEAMAHGPNINAPMDPRTTARAVGLAIYANWLARKGTPAEQALTAAMVKRYSAAPGADQNAMNAAYADAMLAAARAHPGNDDIALLAAEAAMDTRPWDYWTA